jgi:hypothetical protein
MSEPSYVAEAFKLKPNLVGLGVGVAGAAVLGSGLVLLGVLGVEAFFLWGVSTNHRFRRAIRARRR